MRLGPVVALLPLLLAACASADADATDAQSGGQAVSGSQTKLFDQDIPLSPKSVPLEHTFAETLTRYGVTVKPSLGVSGTFGMKDADVHLQVEYVPFPAKVTKIDLSTRGTWSATARVDVDVTAGASWKKSADWRKTFTTGTSLGGKAWDLATLPLASFPLPNAPAITIELDLEVAMACELDFDAELHAYAQIGVEGLVSGDVWYDEALTPNKVGAAFNEGLSKADQFHLAGPPTIGFKDGNLAQVKGRCSIQPSINAVAKLGATGAPAMADVGVKFIVEPYAEVDGTFKGPSDWSIDAKAAIEGTVSPFGAFFGKSWQSTQNLTLFDYELATGTSLPPQ